MEIKTRIKIRSGEFDAVYRDLDPLKDLGDTSLQGVHAFCFCGDKLVLVYAPEKKYWSVPGGGIEKGETWEEAVVREIKEETNMKVLHHELLGYQDVYEPTSTRRQTRSFCIVEPYGEFVSDPDGDVTEIKLVEPAELKQYMDWGVIGDHLLEKVLELKQKYL